LKECHRHEVLTRTSKQFNDDKMVPLPKQAERLQMKMDKNLLFCWF